MLLNIYLLNVDKNEVKGMRPITTLNTYIGATKNFDPDGLYSTDIFGPVGSPQRDDIFSYVDIKSPIISPIVALTLFELKRLYKGIMSGSEFAVWDEVEKDFIKATRGDKGANTGYSFFIKHFHELTPKPNHSQTRQESIDFFYKFRAVALSRYVLVFPAGLRDLKVSDGDEKEHEINQMYRSLITISKTIPEKTASSTLVDVPRWKLQRAFNEIYETFFATIDGKKGLTRGKVTSRRVADGTRNVLSPQIARSKVMGAPDAYRATDTVVGIHQGLRSIMPVTQHFVLNRYLPRVDGGFGFLNLIDKDTLKTQHVKVKPKEYDKFTTSEGVEKLLYSFTIPTNRHKPIEVDGKYIALIYRDDDVFKVFYDIDELPAGLDKSKVSGISLVELLYLSGYDVWNDYFMLITRYPVAGSGSTYPSTIRIETTTAADVVYELEDDWVTRKEIPAISFPRRNTDEFVTAMAPSSTRIKGLQGDYDGDTGSGNATYTNESLREIGLAMTKSSFWIDVNQKIKIEMCDGTAERVYDILMADVE